MDPPAENPRSLPTTYLQSPRNARLKQVVKLRDRRGRDKQRRIVIDGWREVARAAGAIGLEELYFSRDEPLSASQRVLLEQLARQGCALFELDAAVHQKIAFGDRRGAVAVARTPPTGLDRLALPPRPIVAVLEGIEKPGNLGAILRTADATGIQAVIAADPGTDLFNPNAIRASVGTVFTVPVASGEPREVETWLRSHVDQVVVARVDGAARPWDVDFRRSTAIVLGSEARGVTSLWKGDELTSVCIPMCGVADSLNVSVTAAMLLYEALRQRRTTGGDSPPAGR